MALFNYYPYSNFHELNLDWIVSKVKEYIEKTDILSINFNDLKSYVENYFDNLDIQTEVNNKLDQMAQSGELAEIIAEFLQFNSTLAFTTKNALKNASNIAAGSVALTLGTENYLDGLTKIYRVRAVRTTDVVDDINILALTYYPELIAELVKNLSVPNKYLFIGDSYLAHEASITNYLPSYMGLNENDYYVYAQGGSGFSRENNTFLSLLNTAISEISNKDLISDIIVIGGYNDYYIDNYNAVLTAIGTFINTAKSSFPNANIKLAFVGWTKQNSNTIRNSLIKAMRAYQACGQYGGQYISNSQYTHHDYTKYLDSTHPTEAGAQEMARYLASGIKTGSCDVINQSQSIAITVPQDSNPLNITSVSGNIYQFLSNDLIEIFSSASLTAETTTAIANFTGAMKIAEYPESFIRPIPQGLRIAVGCRVYIEGTGWQEVTGACLRFVGDGTNSGGSIQLVLTNTTINNVRTIQIYPFSALVQTIQS